MLDNQLIAIFRPIILAGLSALGYSSVEVVGAGQPTLEGVPTGPTIFYLKTGDHRYGYLKRKTVYNPNTNVLDHIEIQHYETTFQVNALALQNPATPSAPTASDFVNMVAAIMQSDSTRVTLQQNSIGIYRITDVRNPYFVDDIDVFEASPSFDFTLTHKQISTTINPSIVPPIQPGIFPV